MPEASSQPDIAGWWQRLKSKPMIAVGLAAITLVMAAINYTTPVFDTVSKVADFFAGRRQASTEQMQHRRQAFDLGRELGEEYMWLVLPRTSYTPAEAMSAHADDFQRQVDASIELLSLKIKLSEANIAQGYQTDSQALGAIINFLNQRYDRELVAYLRMGYGHGVILAWQMYAISNIRLGDNIYKLNFRETIAKYFGGVEDFGLKPIVLPPPSPLGPGPLSTFRDDNDVLGALDKYVSSYLSPLMSTPAIRNSRNFTG
jgi:hypothetical protein